MLEHGKAVLAEHVLHLVRCQETAPWLSPVSRGLADLTDVIVGGLIAQAGWQHVVNDDLGTRRTGRERVERSGDGTGIQVHGDAEPADDGLPAQVEGRS